MVFFDEVKEPPLFSDVLAKLGGVSKNSDFDTIISHGMPVLFDFTYPISTIDKTAFETFICNYFITRRIASGNYKKWKQWLKGFLLLEMPYYKNLMDSEKIVFEPLLNMDLESDLSLTDGEITHSETETNGTENETGSGGKNYSENGGKGGSYSKNGNEQVTEITRFSDTPQGDSSRIWEITEDEEGNPIANLTDYYITTVTGITTNRNYSESGSNSETNNKTGNESTNHTNGIITHGESETDGTKNSSGQHNTTTTGVNGKSKSELLNEYRSTFLSIFGEIAQKLEKLFYQLVEVDDFLDFV